MAAESTLILSARDLSITWGDTPRYWKWISVPESRFPEVAQLEAVCWLEIRGNISSKQLIPNTTYAAYLVFKLKEGHYGFPNPAQEAIVRVGEKSLPADSVSVFYNKEDGVKDQNGTHTPQERVDGWMEVVLGEFLNDGGDERNISITFREIHGGQWKGGLIVEGIQVKPTSLMLSARQLFIQWGDSPQYWKWISHAESRFPEVAELTTVSWLEIHGNITSKQLSPNKTYVAYLVFKLKEGHYGFLNPTQQAIIKIGENSSPKESVSIFYDKQDDEVQVIKDGNSTHTPHERVDGWMEVVLGEFFNDVGDEKNLSIIFTEIDGGRWKGGLIVEGIEVRPKDK